MIEAAAGISAQLGPDLPNIETNDRQLRDVTAEALRYVVDANDPPSVFVRGGQIVRVVVDEDDRATIQIAQRRILMSIMGRAANWVSTSKKRGTISVAPSEKVADDMAFLAPWPGLPSLVAVSPCPVAARDGSIGSEWGYHAPSRTYVASEPYEHFKGGGAAAAKWLTDEVLGDFPFAKDGGASLANSLGLMVTPFVRPCVQGVVPFHLFDAPTSSTGKTKLAQVCLFPGLGLVEVKAPPVKEEQWNNTITTVLSAGVPALLLDNFIDKIDSPAFMAAVTSSGWTDRRMGGNTEMLVLPNRCLYVGTSNNATMADDFLSRTIYIRLDAGVERPQDRTDFRHPNLLEDWLPANRAKVVGACVAMVETWIAAGMPDGGKTHSRFPSWSRVVGGILASCGVAGFLANEERLHEKNDDEHIAWAQFFIDWRHHFGTREATVQEVFAALHFTDALKSIVGDGDDEKKRKRLGMLLNHRIDRPFGDTRIQKGGKGNTGRRFKAVLQGDTSDTNSLFGGGRGSISGDTSHDGPPKEGLPSLVSPSRFKTDGDTTDLVSPDEEFIDPYA